MIIEMVLTPRQIQAIDELERHWQIRVAGRRWDDSDETCERLLLWLRESPSHTRDVVEASHCPFGRSHEVCLNHVIDRIVS